MCCRGRVLHSYPGDFSVLFHQSPLVEFDGPFFLQFPLTSTSLNSRKQFLSCLKKLHNIQLTVSVID